MYLFIRSRIFLLIIAVTCGFACTGESNNTGENDTRLDKSLPLPANYAADLSDWRQQQDIDLKKDDGWLSLTGLYLLEEGENLVGSAANYKVALPESAPKEFGSIELKEGKATLKLKDGVKATSDGKTFTAVDLIADQDGKANLIEIGSVNFYLLRRENNYSIRVRDRKSKALESYKDRRWFDANEKFRVNAVFEPYDEKREVLVPDVLGGEVTMKVSGLLRFKIDGTEFTLEPFDLGEGFFIVYRDETSSDVSYAGGKYIYTQQANGNELILDFNYSVSPPCDFTKYATCPLPPPQNKLKVKIPAGEKRYDG